ncbi:hypothetical protein C8J57DRAFT_212418 [Mycena rebaudengoi]|nr:hypothetical protein C8J57DRAFT_212418 [Mycena rebaudengoi]
MTAHAQDGVCSDKAAHQYSFHNNTPPSPAGAGAILFHFGAVIIWIATRCDGGASFKLDRNVPSLYSLGGQRWADDYDYVLPRWADDSLAGSTDLIRLGKFLGPHCTHSFSRTYHQRANSTYQQTRVPLSVPRRCARGDRREDGDDYAWMLVLAS